MGVVANRPTNGCVWIAEPREPSGGFGDAGRPDSGVSEPTRPAFAFVAPDGERVLLVPGVLWCPERDLQPRTEYAVVGPELVAGCPSGTNEREYARFTTGDGPDTIPPPAPPSPGWLSCSSNTCDNGGCCGPYTADVFTATWDTVTDESGSVLYSDGESLRAYPMYRWFQETSGRVMFEQNEMFSIGRRRSVGAIRAIDIAGNASAYSRLNATCDGALDVGLFDAGPGSSVRGDSGPPLDAAALDAGHASGCSASANNTSLLGALSLALTTLVVRKR